MSLLKWIIVLIVIFFFGCSSVSQIPDGTHVYKRQMQVTINNQTCVGTCVVKQALSYKIHVEADRIDLMALQTCHRSVSAEDQGGSWDYVYQPQEIEAGCPIELISLDKKASKNAFAMIAIESPDYMHQAVLTCDGVQTAVNGSSICQSKAGLNEQIQFQEAMLVHPDENCPLNGTNDGKIFQLKLNLGSCVYIFGSKSGFHRLITIGTSDLILEKL